MHIIRYIWSQLRILVTFFSHAFRDILKTSKSSRSTILVPLIWLVVILSIILLAGVKFGAPSWFLLTYTIAGLTLVAIAVGVYLYWSVKNPQMLRSEQHQETMRLIDKGYVGTSETGLIEHQSIRPSKLESDSGPIKKVD